MKCDYCGVDVPEEKLQETMGQCPHCASIIRLPPSRVLRTLNPFAGNPVGETPVVQSGPAPTAKADVPAPTPPPTIPPPQDSTAAKFAAKFGKAKATLRGGPYDGAVVEVDLFLGVLPARFTTHATENVRACWYVRKGNDEYEFSAYKD